MEGVGARLGRSSTRYGPATVFNGPVRKWKKRWVHVSPSSSSSSNHHHHHHHNNNNHSLPHNNHISANGTSSSTSNNVNTNNNGHLLLYKWTPLTPSNSNNASSSSSSAPSNGNNNASLPNGDEPPRRKFKYVPVDLLEKQKKEAEEQEAAEKVDDESKLSDGDLNAVEQTPKSDGVDEKPDINDVPMEENQDDNKVVRQDLNESTLDLSLGLVS